MFMPIGGAPVEMFSTPLRATRVVAIMTSKSLTVTDDSGEMLSQDVCKIEYRLYTHFYII